MFYTAIPSSNIRYPATYLNKGKPKFTINKSPISPETPINSYILNHRDNIMYLFDNNEYDQIMTMLPKSNMFGSYSNAQYDLRPISKELNQDFGKNLIHNNLMKYVSHTYSSDDQLINVLFGYCINENDTELLKKIISKTNSTDLFAPNQNIPLVKVVVTKNNEFICNIILAEMQLTNLTIGLFFSSICGFQKINLLEKFLSAGHKIDTLYISLAILNNSTDIIRWMLEHGYDIQEAFNKCSFDQNIDDVHPDIHQMLKLLSEYHIDMTAQINQILIYAIESNNLDLVMYCVENNCDINLALRNSCRCMCLDIIIYLLQVGADINTVTFVDIRCKNIKIIKLLIDHGLNISGNIIKWIFVECFIYADDIADILFLIDCGADSNIIFDREEAMVKNPNYRYGVSILDPTMYFGLNSYLEFVVSMGYISHIKFLAETNFDKLRPELDRLFIMAGANSQLDMATYLLDLGANVHAENDLAFIVACYFGHLDMVQFLLSRIDINNITENLFMITLNGYKEKHFDYQYSTYGKLINGNTFFRNDIYHWGNQSVNIFKLLSQHNAIITDHTILETLSHKFYSREFVACLISNKFDINTTFCIDCFNSRILIFAITDDSLYTKLRKEPVSILELSVYFGKTDVVQLLLDNGANVSINNNGPITIANLMDHAEIKKLLLEYGAELYF